MNSLSSYTRGSNAYKLPSQVFISQFLKQPTVLVADHRHTRGRGNHNTFCVAIKLHESFGLRKSFSSKSGVGMHLSAASLRRQKVEADAQPLQQPHHSTSGFGKECVVVAGNEERCAHPRDPSGTKMVNEDDIRMRESLSNCGWARKEKAGRIRSSPNFPGEAERSYLEDLSRARFSSKTLTRGSPSTPRVRPEVCCLMSWRIRGRPGRVPWQ